MTKVEIINNEVKLIIKWARFLTVSESIWWTIDARFKNIVFSKPPWAPKWNNLIIEVIDKNVFILIRLGFNTKLWKCFKRLIEK